MLSKCPGRQPISQRGTVGDNRPPQDLIPGSAVDVGSQFFALAHSLKRRINAGYRSAGMSMARLQVLHALAESGPTRIGELSEHLDVAARTMTSTVEGLVRDGLVERAPDPNDGRAVLVSMTDRGGEVFAAATEIRNRYFEEIFALLDPADRDGFVILLRKLADAGGLPRPEG
jgi:DNA-binding MarR family transcriptional regulator